MGAQASRLSGSLGGQLAAVIGAVTTIIIVGAGVKAIQSSRHGGSKGDSEKEPDGQEAERPAQEDQAASAATRAPKTEPALPRMRGQIQAGVERAADPQPQPQPLEAPEAPEAREGTEAPAPQPQRQPTVQLSLEDWSVAVGDVHTLSRTQVGELWLAIGGTADTDEEWFAMCTDIGADAAAGVRVVELSEWLRARNYDQSLDQLIHTLDALAAKRPDQEPVELTSAREGAMQRLAEHGKELLPDTRIFVEPYGEGTYVSRHKRAFGSNTHTIQFDDGSTHSVALGKGASHWRVLAAPTIAEANPRRMQTFVHLFGLSTKRVNKAGLDSAVPTFANSSKAMSKPRHTIDLYKCQIDDRRCCQIASMLPLCTTTLARLKLDYGGIADAGAVALSLVLPDCLVLEEVSLSLNTIGDTGGIALAGVLPQCSCELSTFVLRANELGDKTMEEFSKTLRRKSTLMTLDLRR
eukprot:COSAG02_NODE_1630_length_11576_cov_21.066045_5_plen_466_part_00